MEQRQISFEMPMLTASVVESWSTFSDKELIDELANYNHDFAKRFQFADVKPDTRIALLQFFVSKILNACIEVHIKILEMIRLLARDKSGIDILLDQTICGFIISNSGLKNDTEVADVRLLEEAGKCLINVLHQSENARRIFESQATDGLIARLRGFLDGAYEQHGLGRPFTAREKIDIWFFDLRIAFISSATSLSLQSLWRSSSLAMDVFIETVDCAFKEKEESGNTEESPAPTPGMNRAAEAMKVLYNVICRCNGRNLPETARSKKLIELACQSMLVESAKELGLLQHGVNLLTALPKEELPNIVCPQVDPNFSGPKYDCRDMIILELLINTLAEQLDEKKSASERDLLNTYFAVLINICSECKEARRYSRLLILPPLRASDVARRPDEGDTLRNRMVRAIHATVSRDLAAEYLFLLCKRSVPRMIKYTGFGHAAGLFADRGLLGKISERKEGDSEDSDTDEYKNVSDEVNPVSGYIQPKGENPLAGMSDEQKEYEAMKLVNAIDQMMRSGAIKPATIGPDGRPREVSHVLELANDGNNEKEGSSSDES